MKELRNTLDATNLRRWTGNQSAQISRNALQSVQLTRSTYEGYLPLSKHRLLSPSGPSGRVGLSGPCLYPHFEPRKNSFMRHPGRSTVKRSQMVDVGRAAHLRLATHPKEDSTPKWVAECTATHFGVGKDGISRYRGCAARPTATILDPSGIHEMWVKTRPDGSRLTLVRRADGQSRPPNRADKSDGTRSCLLL